MDILWESLLGAQLSIVIKNSDDVIIGACLNFDARSDEAAPLCAVAAFSRSNLPTMTAPTDNNGDIEVEMTTEAEKTADPVNGEQESVPTADPVNGEEESVPLSVVEFLQAVEEPLKDQYLPEAKGKTIYTSLLGTAADLTPAENIKVKPIKCS